MTPKVNILMATYNGAHFLTKQMDSLLAQTYDNITIYIRDDGSSDQTTELIASYVNNPDSPHPVILLPNKGQNLKCPGSFYEILRLCDSADYYAFCDQDDLWYPDKIKWAVEMLENEKSKNDKFNQTPYVYLSAYEYCTENGEIIRRSSVINRPITLINTLYTTPASGFVLVFNEQARQQFVLDFPNVPSNELHDRWFLRCAACFGKTIYDSRLTAAHIRHDAAVTADDSTNSNLFKNFWQNEIMGSDSIHDKEHLIQFAATFNDILNPAQKKILSLFIEKNSFIRQLHKLFYPHALRLRWQGEIALRLLFFFNRI